MPTINKELTPEIELLIHEYSQKLLEVMRNRGHMINPNVEMLHGFERVLKELVIKINSFNTNQ